MFENYFKTAWRSLRKNKTFTILNIAGLSIGLACSLLIALFVLDELCYDRFNTQADHIYRIDEQVRFGDFNYNGTEVPAIMGPAFAKDFNQIRQYTRFKNSTGIVIRKDNENIREDNHAEVGRCASFARVLFNVPRRRPFPSSCGRRFPQA